MENQALIDYIRQQLAAGVSDELLKKTILDSGWSEESMENAFLVIGGGEVSPVQETQPTVKEIFVEESKESMIEKISAGIGTILLVSIFSYAVYQYAPVSIMKAMNLPALYSISTVVVSAIVGILFLFIVRKITLWRYRKESSLSLSYLVGFTAYIFLSIIFLSGTQLVVGLFIKGAPSDVTFGLSLLYSIAIKYTFYVFYAGLFLVIPVLLLSLKKSKDQLPGKNVQSKKNLFGYVFVTMVFFMSIYVSSVMQPIAKTLSMDSLCTLSLHSVRTTNCVSEIAKRNIDNGSTIPASGDLAFRVEKTEYSRIDSLQVIDGKLAYIGKKEALQNQAQVVYDGKVLVDSKGVWSVSSIGGKLVYSFKNEQGKDVIVWDDKEYGKEYTLVLQPTDVGGTLAFLARVGTKQFVVWNGQEYGKNFDTTLNITDLNGKLVFSGVRGGKGYVVVDGREYGPYDRVGWIRTSGDQWVANVDKDGQQKFLLNGDSVNDIYGPVTDFLFIGEKLAFLSQKDKQWTVVFDGKLVHQSTARYVRGLYDVNGQLAYGVSKDEWTTSLMVGDKRYSGLDGYILGLNILNDGKIVLHTMNQTTKKAKNYVDGKEFDCPETTCTSPKMLQDKVMYQSGGGGQATLHLGEDEFSGGFSGYGEPVFLDGKMVIPATIMVDYKTEAYLLYQE